jgi:[DsrC]-trisulfide reductase subunit M
MTAAAYVFAGMFYGAALVLVLGLGARIRLYARTPAPLLIPTTPAPMTRSGAAARVAREVVLFESLFRANLLAWLLGWAFHVALALVLVRHLRYFTDPVPGWLALMQPIGVYAGLAMAVALAGLAARRVAIERVRYISTPSDHLMLLLLLAIAVSGLAMKYVAHTDIAQVKAFFTGLLVLEVRTLPADAPLLVHLTLVAALAIVFPFSKLLHAPAVFFSPSRNQADDPRERRHLAPWAAKLEVK